ncbi:MAG: DUF3310 domain-containing protein [Methanobrevibacter sp.]|uniref:DUF3310 domain-containing protein n=1 Tax=Methanobrevibacter sp. TaxID=66852 RepID=UPI0025E1F152|nr:DUF3310 domain-containing protein [Methanobrevibacter sp.]MBQ6098981.1 DUF3310 domain-containing protein [Methanobrevibacter sp.]
MPEQSFYRGRCVPVPLVGDELNQFKQKLIKEMHSEREDNMEDIPTNIRELEEKGKDCERLAEPEYYAGNGLSPLEAFKKGLLSREETIGFIKGNVIKYTVRAGKKDNASRDIVKAIDYLGHLKRLYEDELRVKYEE